MSQSTNAQLAIDPNKNIAVFASAGTGKTRLLVQRIIKLLLNDVDPSHILAITFTRKAAAEMRERMMKILEDWAGSDDQQLQLSLQELSHPHNPSNISKARKLYEKLLFSEYEIRITTFHAFCQDILKRFALHAGIPAGFHLTETTAELKQEARKRLYKIAHTGNDKILTDSLHELLRQCSTVHNLNNILETFIDSRSDWWSFTENQDDPVNYAIKSLQKFLRLEESDEPQNHLHMIERLHEYQSYLQLHETSTFQKYIIYITNFTKASKKNQHSLGIILPIFLKVDGEPRRIKYSKTLEKSLGPKKLDRFIELHNELIAIVIEKLDVTKKENLLTFNQAWFYVGNLLINEYQQLKFARNTLDFDDLEWYSYLLLNKQDNADWIQYKLDQRIDHILIDEFQDTNPTQWNLIFPLLEELAAKLQQSTKSLFFVGDTKQSIYGFRRANPQLQFTASTWAKRHLNAELLETDLSFRSSPAIIDFVNRVFVNRGAALIKEFRAHQAVQNDLWGYVQVNSLITPANNIEDQLEFRNPLLQARKNAEINCHYQEGQYVAKQINKLINNCTSIYENGHKRLLHYDDIIILTRSRIHSPQIELALREQGIPYTSISDNNFLKQLEVLDILALLTYLIQPHNDLALAQVLRSPCFGISDEDLMAIVSIDANSWHEKLEVHAKNSSNSILSTAFEKLQNWRHMANRIPVHDLLDKIYFETNLLKRYSSSCTTAKKNHVLANLTYILQLTLDIDAGRYSSVQSFLDSLQKLKASEICTNNADIDQYDDKAVRIMTVHSAKGLEAPVVFVIDTGSSPSKQRPYQKIVNWPSSAKRPEQFFIIGKKDTIDKKTQLRLKQQLSKDWNEELNLLYVALTRAKQYLFISGVQTKKDQDNCWFSIIEQALDDNGYNSKESIWTFTHGNLPVIKGITEKKSLPENKSAFDFAKPFAITEVQLSEKNQTEIITEPIEHGILVHKLFELLTQQDIKDSSKLHREAEFALTKEISLEKFSTALEEVNNCIHSPELKEIFVLNPEKEILSEVPVCYRENGQVLYGIIDRLIISDKTTWIIDFKTTAEVTKSSIQQQAQHYRQQISNYFSAVKTMYPKKDIRASILFTSISALYTFDTNELTNQITVRN